MTRDETAALLRARSGLTSQPFGGEVIDAWHAVLRGWTFDQCRAALLRCADHERIGTAHLLQHLPPRARPGSTSEPRNDVGECMHRRADMTTLPSWCPDCRGVIPTPEVGYQIAMRAAEEERARIQARRRGEPTPGEQEALL